jgi:[ribosomal protein S5]-alanine N-acetyltransferase
MKTPKLVGYRATLVEFTESFITENYVSWLNDHEIVRFSENRHHETTLASCHDYLGRMQQSGNIFWAILANNLEGRHVGNITIYADKPNKVCDLAILVGDPVVRGKGVGTDAANLACDWLLGAGGYRKITVGMMADNEPMLNLMSVVGMTEEGRRSKQFLLDGKEVDMIFAAKFKDTQ